MKYYSLFAWLIFITSFSHAQDIEALSKATPLTISGGVQASTAVYNMDGTAPARQIPFIYQIGGNINLNFLGLVDVPFSFQYSPQGENLNLPRPPQQPFNQFGMSPSYKWIKLHGGYRSMSLSEYTYNGGIFLGGGVELTPTKFPVQFKAFSGRLAKAATNEEQVSRNPLNVPVYDQYGIGLQVGFKTKGATTGSINIFKAWDQIDSRVLADSASPLRPQDNIAISATIKTKLFKQLQLEGEIATSALTRDVTAQSGLEESYTFQDNLNPFVRHSNTTDVNYVYGLGANYQIKSTTLGAKYRRVDPNYSTLGLPFINNDIEDITLNLATKFLKNKIGLTTAGGLQRNNLENQLAEENRKWIGNIALNLALVKNLTINLNAANFTTTTTKVQITELDSLNFYQITNNYSANIAYQIPKPSVTQVITTNASYQTAEDVNGNNNQLYNTAVNYAIAHNKISLNYSIGANATANSMTGLDVPGIGINAAFSKGLLKYKLKTSFSFNQLMYKNSVNYNDDVTRNYALNVSYSIKKHQLALISTYTTKNQPELNIQFNEFKGQLKYSYSFSTNSKQWKKNKSKKAPKS